MKWLKFKNNTPTNPWFVGGSLAGFGLLMVVTLLLVSKSTSTSSETQDFRAKASNAKGIPITGKVVSIDIATKTMVVESLKMTNSDAQLPGTWTAKADDTTDISAVTPGGMVLLDVNPPTFSIDQRTFVVYSVTVSQ